MESQIATQPQPQGQQPLSVSGAAGKSGYGLGNVFCKCEQGWTCVITRTEPDGAKTFFKCGENCTCSIDGGVVSGNLNLPSDVLSSMNGSQAFCHCGEGWSCVISRSTEEAGKGFFECAGDCTCVVDAETTQVEEKSTEDM